MSQKTNNTQDFATGINTDCLCVCTNGNSAGAIISNKVSSLTREQHRSVSKLKDLSRILSDYVVVIEESTDPSTGIQDAIEAVDYYSRLLHTMQKL